MEKSHIVRIESSTGFSAADSLVAEQHAVAVSDVYEIGVVARDDSYGLLAAGCDLDFDI